MHKILLCFLILSAAFRICSAQEKSQAGIIDEFADYSCERYLGRIDNFFEALRNDLKSSGYVVISSKKDSLFYKLRYKFWFLGNIKFRRFDGSRIKIIESEDSPELRVQFWYVPENAEIPFNLKSSWNYSLLINKPVNLNEYFFDSGTCPIDGFEGTFLKILQANPNLRANLVIHGKNRAAFNKEKAEILKRLSPIDQSRLKFFYVNSIYDDIEYWLLPKGKIK